MNKPDLHSRSNLDKALAGEPRSEADRLREVWALAAGEEPTTFPDADAIARVWSALETAAASPEEQPPRRRVERAGVSRLRRVRLRPWMAVAATLLVGAAVGVWTLWLAPVVKTAAPGQRLALTLPDGSQVELNSGTTLRYAGRFGEGRVVYLDGEAFFDVVKEDRPFVVHTFNARVIVLGTRFNVRAWSRSMDPGTTVALESGRVALAPAHSPEQVVALEPGQMHRIARDLQEPSPPDTVAIAQATAWRNGDFIFIDQWLGVILEEAERRFAVELTLEPLTLRERSLTFTPRNPASAEVVIRDLCVALGLSYRETSNGYELYAPSPP